MSMLKAKQRQTLKRTSSCPDMHQILEIVAAKNKNYYPNHPEEEELSGKSNIKTIDEVSADDAAGDETMIQDDSCAAKAVNASVQTDEFLVSPYEHLFPFVIPQWIPNSAAADNSRKMPTGGDTPTPYLLLDHYVEAAYKSTGDQGGGIETDLGKLREEIALLHSQLLYERHRRETLGLRNRRLLGKTKSSRVLEEQNTSLVSLVFSLFFINQLHTYFRMIVCKSPPLKCPFCQSNLNNCAKRSIRVTKNIFSKNVSGT